jgi:hypothetical protein
MGSLSREGRGPEGQHAAHLAFKPSDALFLYPLDEIVDLAQKLLLLGFPLLRRKLPPSTGP